MTLREIDWRLTAIVERKQRDLEIEATLHGMKIKGGGPSAPKEKMVDDKAKAVFDKILKEEDHGKRRGNKGWRRV